MEALYITLAALLGAALLIFLFMFVFAALINRAVFGSRKDKNPLIKYFTAEDFDLTAEEVDICCVKNRHIRGAIYKKEGVEAKNELIIFCHGMGPGHIAYTTEIAYFCGLGYTVLAPDYEGCNLSDGRKIKGFSNGRLSVRKAVYYAKENLDFDKIYLVGHSWGGYSALCAVTEIDGVDKVVAISAPDLAQKAIYDALAARMPKFFAKMLYPFLAFFCADQSAAFAAEERTDCKILLVHGDSDRVVSPDNAVYFKSSGAHIEKYLAEGKRHNPYNTVSAENKLSELSSKLTKSQLEKFDFKAATEEDSAVMEEIARFLAKTE